MANKSTAIAKAPSEADLALLRNEFPVEQGFQGVQLPRLGFKSQDVTEGKGRAMQVVIEAGTFLDEYPKKDKEGNPVLNTDGKAEWAHDDLGKEIEVTIVFKRKQLRMYDEGSKTYLNTPIFDEDTEVVPLFKGRERIAEGNMKQLQAKYMSTGRNGKPQSDLEENVILYVLHDGELKQLNLRGSSMWNFKKYARATLVPSVLTALSSEERENGATEWNAMTFKAVRPLNADEVKEVIGHVRELKEGIQLQKEQFASPERDPLASEFDVEDDDPLNK